MKVYSVRLAGTLPAGALESTGSSQLVGAPQTILNGEVRDDAALYGLLRRIQALNIAVLEVRRLPSRHPHLRPEGGQEPAIATMATGPIDVEAIVAGAVGEAAQSFLGELLRSETVQTQLRIRSPLATAEVVTRLEAAGAQVLAIHVEPADGSPVAP